MLSPVWKEVADVADIVREVAGEKATVEHLLAALAGLGVDNATARTRSLY